MFFRAESLRIRSELVLRGKVATPFTVHCGGALRSLDSQALNRAFQAATDCSRAFLTHNLGSTRIISDNQRQLHTHYKVFRLVSVKGLNSRDAVLQQIIDERSQVRVDVLGRLGTANQSQQQHILRLVSKVWR